MNTTQTERHGVAVENAHKFDQWLRARGGILVWKSHDLGNPGRSVSTPALTEDGKPYPRPGWQFVEPSRHITDPNDVEVYTVRVVELFPIKLKQSQGRLVLTNASDRRVKLALDRAGEGSFYRFGATGTSQGSAPHALMYGEDTVSICVEDAVVPLPEWLAANPSSGA